MAGLNTGGGGGSIGLIDAAETFDGSDGETVTRSDTVVADGSVSIRDGQNSTATRPDDNGSYLGSSVSPAGLEIKPTADCHGVTVSRSVKGSWTGTVELRQKSDNTLLDSGTMTVSHGGGEVTLSANLVAGTTYFVLGVDSNDSFGYHDSPNPPYTSQYGDITGGGCGWGVHVPRHVRVR